MTREELLQNAKPILFNTDMVRAILDGRKTATRRVIKHNVEAILNSPYHKEHPEVPDKTLIEKLCKPLYGIGDILYVRETWKKAPNGYFYYEDWERGDIADVTKWKPSIHMPKEAARIFLKVKDVRVERLQDIMKDPPGPNNQIVREGCAYGCDFIAVWNSTIKKADIEIYGWDANPWVWVIEFERIEPGKE